MWLQSIDLVQGSISSYGSLQQVGCFFCGCERQTRTCKVRCRQSRDAVYISAAACYRVDFNVPLDKEGNSVSSNQRLVVV